MFTKPSVFVFDIDGTLADHHGVRSPYDESKVLEDRPIYPVVEVLLSLVQDHKVIFLSGRTELCRKETIAWIRNVLNKRYRIVNIELYMRQARDGRKDAIVKKEIYDRDILPNYNVIGVFDDRLQVCQMLYENNIFCFNVNQGLKEF